MHLGTFSIGLAVKDFEASRSFDERSGFREVCGDASQSGVTEPASFVAVEPVGNPVLVGQHA